jgi:hypothetical protein
MTNEPKDFGSTNRTGQPESHVEVKRSRDRLPAVAVSRPLYLCVKCLTKSRVQYQFDNAERQAVTEGSVAIFHEAVSASEARSCRSVCVARVPLTPSTRRSWSREIGRPFSARCASSARRAAANNSSGVA